MAARDFEREVRPVLENFCTDCHDPEMLKGGLDLARFNSDAAAMADRATWKRVFDQIEAGQMPPPKRKAQPTAAERATLMAFASELMARPDPALGVRDPGKPVLRRLTRLEYNNTVRDLLGLPTDVFMFPERLPFSDKSYFQPAAETMGDTLQASLREYGARQSVLLPQAGLPGDGRAEHGFNNRGDVMNFSPLVLEQFVALAAQIANHPDLTRLSPFAAELLGVEFTPAPEVTELKKPASSASPVSPAVGVFAPNVPKLAKAEGSADNVESRFREEVAEAFREGRGGVFDVGATSANATIAGKGGLLRVPFGDAGAKTLTINPDADLWLASFATAEETSGSLLIANKTKKEKRYELTFKVLGGENDEGIARLGVCVIGRSGQSGTVTLTTRFSDGTEAALSSAIAEGSKGTTFFSFAAVPGEHVKSLVVDGSKFSGDYVLLDDLGFITTGRAVPNARPPATVAAARPASPSAKPAIQKKATAVRSPKSLPPVERLNRFLDRALRHPATPDERARFTGLFERERDSGKAETDALRVVISAILSSPGFLFLAEPARDDGAVRALDDYEIASRLSYFLWSSMPDDELLAAAGRGELRTEVGLGAQVKRMLRDAKARELSESFAVQWLRLDQLYTTKPDRDLFPAFYSGPQGKDTLHGNALTEVLLLFETILVEDRSIVELISADYTWLNPRLRKIYGLEDSHAASLASANGAPTPSNREVKQAERNANNVWQRVALTDRNRGGVLTMSGTLTATSLPFRTSPVKRGAWLLETIFNRPPAEPKVAFALKDDAKEVKHAESVRERFEQHRNDPNCFSCHVRLDPPGFALEAFDPIGKWRERDGEALVDASGEWGGRKFAGPAEFKAILAEKPDEFVRGFIEHLLSYALGRKIEHYDTPTIAEIQQAVAQQNYRLSAVVAEIVKSHPFRYIRNTPAAAAR